MEKFLNKNTNILIATFSPWIGGRRLPINGNIEPLIDFFAPKVKKLVLIDQVAPGSDTVMPRTEVYEKGKKIIIVSCSKWLYVLYPFLKLTNTINTHITFKLRDFLSVVDWCLQNRKTTYDYFIGLECINALAGIVLRKFGLIKKVIYYVSDYSPQRYPSKWFNNLYLKLDRYAAMHADYIWDVSPAIQPARIAAGLDPDLSSPVIHVPNGLDPSQINHFPLDKVKPFTLVFMGHLGIENGPDVIIKAMPKVLKEFPKTKLFFIGGREIDLNRLKKKAIKKKVAEKVKFYGFIKDRQKMSDILRNCQIGLAPYLAIPGSPRYYGDAGKIRAYAAAGLPVIATDVPPLGQELKKQGGALIVKDNPQALASAIIKIFSNRKLYLRLRKNAIAFAKGNTWENSFTHAFEKMGRI